MAEQLAKVSPAVAEQFAAALATGSEVRIPFAEYAARIAPTEYAQSLVDDLRVEGEQFTRRGAQEYMQTHAQTLEEDVRRVMEEKQDDAAFRQSADKVKETIKSQLDATSRFISPVNDAYAVLGAKFGVSPEEMYARYTLKVGVARASGVQFEQGSQNPVTAISGREFYESGEDTASMRKAARKWYNTTLKGSSVVNAESGREVHFRDARKAFNSSADPDKIRLFAALKHLVEHGKIQKTELPSKPNEHKNTKAYHWLTAWVDLDGLRVEVGVTLREDNTGALYYNHNPVIKKATAVPELSDPAHKAGVGTDSTMTYEQSVVPDGDSINLYILNQGARGSFNPSTNTITLLRGTGKSKGADLSTFLHESAHFFLEVQFDLATQLEAKIARGEELTEGEREFMADTRTVLDWFGVRDLTEWYMLDFEEKRSYHEKYAESFEAYLHSGKAPSIELQPLFQKFRAWMIGVYKSLEAFLEGHPDAGQLNDEVRGVFDRMLATNEEIKLAEQARSMMPLFATAAEAEKVGISLEEFAAYQAWGWRPPSIARPKHLGTE